MTREMEFDIRANADDVVALLEQGRTADALRQLEERREGQPQAIQEALDRYIAAGAAPPLQAHAAEIRSQGLAAIGERLQAACDVPRMMDHATELAQLSESQRFDIYASIAVVRGGAVAERALERQSERVILGMRQETDTRASARHGQSHLRAEDVLTTPLNESSRGTGVYDDRLLVLWTDAQGQRRVHAVLKGNTEPTAQYDHHAGNDGLRPLAAGGIDRARLTPTDGYESVRRRKIEGEDVDGDGVRDLGRLREGTYEMGMATHPNPQRRGHLDPALRPTAEAERVGAGHVERDTNADGRFTLADINGIRDLNRTFKIHRGSMNNTDSAGCQTIHPDEYMDFMDAVRGNPNQTTWRYILTSTHDGQQVRQALPDQVPPPARMPPPLEGNGRVHPLLDQARDRVRALDDALGRSHDDASERMAGALAVLARESGLQRIDHVVLSRDGGAVRAGERVFVVQGALDDPAHLRAHMRTGETVRAPVAESLQRLDALPLAAVQVQTQAVDAGLQREQHDSPRRSLA